MTQFPTVKPRYAPQPADVAWPTADWPEGVARREVDDVVDEAFSDPQLDQTNAVVVVRAGRVIAERYGGTLPSFDGPGEPVTTTTPMISWSMAKSVLHAAVGLLVAEGRLDPARPAPVAEWRDDERRAITLGDLLAMRDGLDFVEAYELGQPSHVIEMLFGDGQRDMGAFAAARPLAWRPGEHFNYSSGTSNIVSRIVADLVGRGEPYRAWLAARLFDQLGMASATPTLDESGVFVASSYLHATARDFAKFGLLYLRGGRWGDRQLLATAWTDTAQVPHSHDESSGLFYAWHWWVTGDHYGTYGASGYEGQMISVVPALDAVVVRLGRTPEERAPALEAWRSRLLDVLA